LELSVYPNPATDRLMISNPSENIEDAELRILDISGKLLKSRRISYWLAGQIEYFDTSELGGGIYFLRVVSGAGVATFRFIVL